MVFKHSAKGNNSYDSVGLPGQCSPFKMGSTPKGKKNLLLKELFLFFKSLPQLKRQAAKKMVELLPLKVYPVTQKLGPKKVASLLDVLQNSSSIWP